MGQFRGTPEEGRERAVLLMCAFGMDSDTALRSAHEVFKDGWPPKDLAPPEPETA